MPWEGPGFVDRHSHLLQHALGRLPLATEAELRRIADRWSTPLDEPVPPLEVHDGVRGALERALVRAREVGLVEVTEAGIDSWAYLEALLALRAREPLPVRVRLLVASGIAEPKQLQRTGDPWLEVEGVLFWADGDLATHTCALREPFTDRRDAGGGGDTGRLFLTADELARRCDPFAEAGWTIATKATGDRAIATVLDAYERVFGRDCAEAAPRIHLPVVLSDELVRRIAALGVVACVAPGAAVAEAAASRPLLGERIDWAHRWDELLAAGARVVAGSGFPTCPLEPLVGLQRLVTGQDEAGRATPAPTLSLGRALAVLTDPAAGTTVLSDDPARVAEDELAQVEIVETRPSA